LGSRGKAGTIYTIGSSTRAFSEFLELLRMYEIATLVDVRTTPYSKRFPHFSKQSLEELFPSQTVGYVYLGKELGGANNIPPPRSWRHRTSAVAYRTLDPELPKQIDDRRQMTDHLGHFKFRISVNREL